MPWNKPETADNEESTAFLEAETSRTKNGVSSKRQLIFPWVLVVTLAGILAFQLMASSKSYGKESLESGWSSDLVSAKSQIKVEQQIFHSKPAEVSFESKFTHQRRSLRYEGIGDDVDHAWAYLLQGQYFLLTKSEAQETWGDKVEDFWDDEKGGYRASIGVLHALHCVNYFRTLTSSTLEQIERQDGHARDHHAHCLGQIRQYLMCSTDLSPMPAIFGRDYPDTDIVHTCRNFHDIREWAWERHNGSLAVPPSSGGEAYGVS